MQRQVPTNKTMTRQPLAPPLTEAGVLAALRDCYHPEILLNIVDLGLVQSIAIAPDPDAPGLGIRGVPSRYRVGIAILVTDLDSTEDSPLPAIIRNRLAAFETISRTEVDVRSQPVWTPERISPEGRIRLAAHLKSRRPARDLVQINFENKT
jgi:metal-sulfur cluster biosynthetic enzyme